MLVVDDDEAVRQVASKVLRRAGYRVLEAKEGEEALSIAALETDGIDLVLTDVVMPGMGGRELGEAMSERHPGVPVVFMSAYTEDEVILGVSGAPKVHFIPKPFTVAGLRDKVREVLELGR